MRVVNKLTSTISELVANRILELDCEAHGKLKAFENKVISAEITDLNLRYFVRIINGTLVITDHYQGDVSAQISGKSSAFVGAAINERSSDAVFSGNLHFSGDVGLAQKFQAFIQSLQIDWQQPLSNIVGDELSYAIGQGFEKFGSFIKNAFEQTALDIPEYLQHEIKATPSSIELEYFYQSIDKARSQTERLEARIKRLT